MKDALAPRSITFCRIPMDDGTDPQPHYALFPANRCVKDSRPRQCSRACRTPTQVRSPNLAEVLRALP
jgi:hypothetical protein